MSQEKESLGLTSARLLSSLYLGQFLGIIVTVLTLIIVTRWLGPSNYGIYTFAFGFAALIDAIGNFGIGTYFGKNLAKHNFLKDHAKVVETLVSGYSILLPLSLLLSLIGIGASSYVANVLFKSLAISPFTLILASSIIFFQTTQSTSVQALIGLTRGKLASYVSLFVDIIQLFASLFLLYLGFGVNGAIAGMLIGYILGAALGILLILKVVSRAGPINIKLPSAQEIKQALSFLLPMGMSNVLNFSMANFAILYLSIFVSTAVLGNYGAALKGLNFIQIFYFTTSTALLPLFATAFESKDKEKVEKDQNRLLAYSLMISLPFILFIGVLAVPGARLLLSGTYGSAGTFLSLIAFGSLIDTLQYFLSVLLISRGLTTALFKSLLISAIIQLAGILLLVPSLGVFGAIISIFFIGPTVEVVLFTRLAKNLTKFNLDYKKIGMLFLSNIILAIPLSAALLLTRSSLEIVAGIIILAIAYPAILVFLKVVENSDMELLKKVSAKIPLLKKPADLLLSYFSFLMNLRGSS